MTNTTIMDDKDETIKQLERKLKDITNKHDQLRENYNILIKQNISNTNTNNKHSNEFWGTIYRQCKTNPDYVKSLIKQKILTMDDTNSKNRTLLLIAAQSGSYEITQLCLNLGANINHRDTNNRTALQLARDGAWYHIEQLLLFNQLNANIGDRIHETSNQIKKQKGIIENIIKQLSKYDDTTRQFFQDTMIDIMINTINDKLSFPDILLNLCWEFEIKNQINYLESNLWETISKVSTDIIKDFNHRDWHWFKTFIIPSLVNSICIVCGLQQTLFLYCFL